MESTKVSALLLICMLFVSMGAPIFGCKPPSHKHPTKGKGKGPGKGTVAKPPPIVKKPPPVTVPPIVKPPITLPPVVTPPPVTTKPCPPPPPPPLTPPPPPPPASCPADSLKLGACVDLLGGLVHIGLGDPVVNACCPVLGGLLELEAAVCLCTTLKIKLLNLSIFVPIALELLVTCGKAPPPGFSCTL